MIKYTTGFVDKLEDILQESNYAVRYERGNFQSGWCLLDHKRVVVLNKFLNTEGRVNTLVELIPQLKIDYDKLTLNSQKLFEFLTENKLEKIDKGAGQEESGRGTEADDQDASAGSGSSDISSDENEADSYQEQAGSEEEDTEGPER